MLTLNKFHDCKAAEERERENLWRGRINACLKLQAYQKAVWGLGHRHPESRCVCPSWHPTVIGTWSSICVITPGSGPWEFQEGCPQGLSQVPMGMAERH